MLATVFQRMLACSKRRLQYIRRYSTTMLSLSSRLRHNLRAVRLAGRQLAGGAWALLGRPRMRRLLVLTVAMLVAELCVPLKNTRRRLSAIFSATVAAGNDCFSPVRAPMFGASHSCVFPAAERRFQRPVEGI